MTIQRDFVIEDNGRLTAYHGPGGEVTIPEGVLKIGEGAFAGSAALTGVTVPEGAEEIEKEAFLGCAGLRRVTLPVGLARIGKRAFKDCVCLEEIPFPKGLCHIGGSAFVGCVRLKEAMLPEGLTDMGSLAFYGCEGLLQAEIPGSLRELASSVFGDCVSLKRIVLHEGLEAVSIYAFSNCRSLSELEFPRGLASVGHDSFQGCAGLTRLTIPKDTRLEFDGRTVPHQTTPFADSVSLTDIQVDGENPYYEAQDGGLYEKGCGNLIFWFGTGERAVIPAFVSRLAVGAFESRKDLKEFAVETGSTKFIAQGPALYKLDKKKNPVLVCWALNQGEAVIAPGTVRIERRAFAGRDKLTGVRIPDSVTNIEREAFWGCASLEEVHIPGSVRTLRERTFFGCTRLKQVDFSEGLEKTEHSVFENCKALEELHFPQSMVHICASSFCGCTSLKRVTASKNLTSFPYWPHYNSREGLPYFSLEPSFLAGKEACPEQLSGVLWCASEEDLARAALFQTGEEWKKAMGRRLEAEPELTDGIIRNMMALLKEEEKPEKALWERAAAFVLAWKEQAGEETLGAFYEMCREGACPVLDELEASASQAEEAADTVRAECAADAAQADSAESAPDAAQAEGAESAKAQAERAAEENWIDGTLVQEMGRKVKQGVPYAGLGELCSAKVLIWLLAACYYAKPGEGDIWRIAEGKSEGKLFGPRSKTMAGADAIAAALDREALLEYLDTQIYVKRAPGRNKVDFYIPAYCRYAGEERIERLIKQGEEWEWSSGGDCAEFVRESLYLSGTRAALRSCENLEAYAAMRGGSVQDLRDILMTDMPGPDLDEEGKKVYDLGGRQVEAVLDKDLNISLYDTSAGKHVKSLPKAGADSEAYKAAKAHLTAMKKEIRRIAAQKKEMLFTAFLEGSRQTVKSWRTVYLENPLLRRMAGWVVWSQGGRTFTLKGKEPVDAQGNPITLGEQPIFQAHPMEMENEETAAWQNYFLTRLGGKQLYLQMWEPVYRAEEISPDRYKGIDIPLKRFMDRKADGIIYTYDNSYAGLGLGFADCEAEWEAEGIRRGGPDLDAKVTIKEFRFPRFTRRVNHLVGLLDRWSLSQLIERDDAAVSKLLGKLTLPKEETEQYLEQAIACGAKNCTAALLEYKNAHRGAVDPMDAFVLD